MFKRILISTDFSEASSSAIGHGINLAWLCGAYVEVIHVVSSLEESLHMSILDSGSQIKWKARLETYLDLALPDEAYPGAKKSLLWGASIPGEILEHAVKENFDLIVCGSHGRGLIRRALLGNITQELSRNSSIPVLVVPPIDRVRFSNGIDRILVPMDFSQPSLDALDFAIRLAEAFNSAIILLHSIYVPVFAETRNIYPILMTVSADDELKRDASARLKAILKVRTCPPKVEMEVKFGEPVAEISYYVEENDCSCIIMGSHGRKGLERAILGSVTTNVLARTKVPVFTLAPRF